MTTDHDRAADTPERALKLLDEYIRTGDASLFHATLHQLETADHSRVVERMKACGNPMSIPQRAVTLLEHRGLITNKQFLDYVDRVAVAENVPAESVA